MSTSSLTVPRDNYTKICSVSPSEAVPNKVFSDETITSLCRINTNFEQNPSYDIVTKSYPVKLVIMDIATQTVSAV